jgi:hypothetical protein
MGSDRVDALAQRTDLILFWVGFLALHRGFSQIMLAFSIRQAGEEAAASYSARPPLTRPTCRGAGVTGGSSITTSSFSADARSRRPDHATSRRPTSQRPDASGLTGPAALAGPRSAMRPVGGEGDL